MPRTFYKTTYVVEILHEAPIPDDLSLAGVMELSDTGPYVLDVKSNETVEVDEKAMAELLVASRSEPGFFDINADDLCARYEYASGNTVKGNIIVDDAGRLLCAPGGNPVLYTDDLAREYLEMHGGD